AGRGVDSSTDDLNSALAPTLLGPTSRRDHSPIINGGSKDNKSTQQDELGNLNLNGSDTDNPQGVKSCGTGAGTKAGTETVIATNANNSGKETVAVFAPVSGSFTDKVTAGGKGLIGTRARSLLGVLEGQGMEGEAAEGRRWSGLVHHGAACTAEVGSSGFATATVSSTLLTQKCTIGEGVSTTTGFSTGRGRPVKVSADALARVECMFWKKTEEWGETHQELVDSKSGGLRAEQRGTGGGSCRKQEQLLSRNKCITRAGDAADDCAVADTSSTITAEGGAKTMKPTVGGGPSGCSTDNGRAANVSINALARVGHMFGLSNDPVNSVTPGVTMNTRRQVDFNPVIPMLGSEPSDFSTGKGREVRASPDALIQVGHLLGTGNGTVGSTSAVSTKRAVPVLAESLIQADKVFNGDKENEDYPASSVSHLSSGDILSISFSTGIGRAVSISADTLARAEQMFARDKDGKDHPSSAVSHVVSGNDVPSGFSTGRGRVVPVSADALVQAEQMFARDKDDKGHSSSTIHMRSGDGVARGFSAGRGRVVPVSADALGQAKQMFSGDKEKDQYSSTTIHVRSGGAASGFSTGRGRVVSVSADALAQAKQMFSRDKDDKVLPASVIGSVGSGSGVPSGFSTGSGREVPVSAEALARAEQIFAGDKGGEHDKDCPNADPAKAGARGEDRGGCRSVAGQQGTDRRSDEAPVKTAPPGARYGTSGFSTGRGVEVKVSAKALAKVNRFFAEEKETEGAGRPVTGSGAGSWTKSGIGTRLLGPGIGSSELSSVGNKVGLGGYKGPDIRPLHHCLGPGGGKENAVRNDVEKDDMEVGVGELGVYNGRRKCRRSSMTPELAEVLPSHGAASTPVVTNVSATPNTMLHTAGESPKVGAPFTPRASMRGLNLVAGDAPTTPVEQTSLQIFTPRPLKALSSRSLGTGPLSSRLSTGPTGWLRTTPGTTTGRRSTISGTVGTPGKFLSPLHTPGSNKRRVSTGGLFKPKRHRSVTLKAMDSSDTATATVAGVASMDNESLGGGSIPKNLLNYSLQHFLGSRDSSGKVNFVVETTHSKGQQQRQQRRPLSSLLQAPPPSPTPPPFCPILSTSLGEVKCEGEGEGGLGLAGMGQGLVSSAAGSEKEVGLVVEEQLGLEAEGSAASLSAKVVSLVSSSNAVFLLFARDGRPCCFG
ncbi:unnamed protein product, partial [Choristocarpus tenellus]